MTGKYSVIRSESRLKNIDPKIQKLFDSKHIEIIRAQEAEAEEAEETQEELIKTLLELILENSDKIEELTEVLHLKIESKDSESEIKEKITKGLKLAGFDIKMVQKGRRVKVQ